MRSASVPVDPVSLAGELMRRYLGSVLDGDQPAAIGIVGEALSAGLSREEVVGLIRRALVEVGGLWERKEITVADEHMASEITASVLERHVPFGAAADMGRSAVVACPGGETHVLGARAVAGLLRERGWHVAFLGAATPPAALAALVAARRPALVVLSVKMATHIDAAREAIALVKALDDPPAVLVGGRALAHARSDIGADLVVQDLDVALAFTDKIPV